MKNKEKGNHREKEGKQEKREKEGNLWKRGEKEGNRVEK